MAEVNENSIPKNRQLTQGEISTSSSTTELEDLDGEALYNIALNLIKNRPVQAVKKEIEWVKQAFDRRMAKAGKAIDFTWSLTSRFNRLLRDYREKSGEFHRQRERELEENRKEREALIEALKQLYQKPENAGTALDKFRAIQRRWKDAGPVPRRYSNGIFKTYHHHLENFYDYLHLDRALREKDFQNNLREKERIIAHAKALVAEPNIHKAFNELQYLHKLWKEEIGPVDKKYREPLWKAFKAATKQIHDRRREYFHKRDEKQRENLAEKKAITAQLIEISHSEPDDRRDWQKQVKRFDALHREFTAIGEVPRASRNETWEAFRAVCRSFNRKKVAFYKGLKREQRDNLATKMALVQTAAANREREDWGEAVGLYKEIQQEWKRIGEVPQHKSKEIWEAFRSHCDYFFDRYRDRHKAGGKGLAANVEKKEALIEKARDINLPDDKKGALCMLQGLTQEWIDAGRLPEERESLNEEFHELLNAHYDTLASEKTALALKKYQTGIAVLAGDKDKLFHETESVKHRIGKLKRELDRLENNIAFFSGDTVDSPLLRKAQQNVETLQQALAIWHDKLDFLRAVSRPKSDG